jgi:hypothetical protein
MDRQTRHILRHNLRCQHGMRARQEFRAPPVQGGSGLDLRESSGLGVAHYSRKRDGQPQLNT